MTAPRTGAGDASPGEGRPVLPPPFEGEGPGPRKRNSCKAIVFRNDEVLLTANRDSLGIFHLLPGGGQLHGETLADALVREVLEETGWVVRPGDLLLVRDYIGANHQFACEDGDVHQTELMFRAEMVRRLEGTPVLPDPWQTGVEWVALDRLPIVRIYPSVLSTLLPALRRGTYDGPVYLGDVN